MLIFWTQVCHWIRSCFEALDKKFLNSLVLGLYIDPADSNTLLESYRFSYFVWTFLYGWYLLRVDFILEKWQKNIEYKHIWCHYVNDWSILDCCTKIYDLSLTDYMEKISVSNSTMRMAWISTTMTRRYWLVTLKTPRRLQQLFSELY